MLLKRAFPLWTVVLILMVAFLSVLGNSVQDHRGASETTSAVVVVVLDKQKRRMLTVFKNMTQCY